MSAVYRWIQRGVRGVRLESITIGGTTYTSWEALARFAERLSASRGCPSVEATPASAARKRQLEQAARKVLHGKRSG